MSPRLPKTVPSHPKTPQQPLVPPSVSQGSPRQPNGIPKRAKEQCRPWHFKASSKEAYIHKNSRSTAQRQKESWPKHHKKEQAWSWSDGKFVPRVAELSSLGGRSRASRERETRFSNEETSNKNLEPFGPRNHLAPKQFGPGPLGPGTIWDL